MNCQGAFYEDVTASTCVLWVSDRVGGVQQYRKESSIETYHSECNTKVDNIHKFVLASVTIYKIVFHSNQILPHLILSHKELNTQKANYVAKSFKICLYK